MYYYYCVSTLLKDSRLIFRCGAKKKKKKKNKEKKRDGASIFFRALGSDRHIFFRLNIFIRKVSKSFSCVDTAEKHSSTLNFILFSGSKVEVKRLKWTWNITCFCDVVL
jgi:hypothetical protein